MSITVIPDRTTARPGDFVTYTLTYTNTGTDIAYNVLLSLHWPPQFALQDPTGYEGWPSGDVTVGALARGVISLEIRPDVLSVDHLVTIDASVSGDNIPTEHAAPCVIDILFPLPPPATAITSVTLAASPPAPQPVGTPLTLTATAIGGVRPYEFKWLTFDGSGWNAATNWSTSNTFAWKAPAIGQNIKAGVWARSAGATSDIYEASCELVFAVIVVNSITRIKNLCDQLQAALAARGIK